MNQEERIKAFTLRCEGKTWAQIGELMHYNEQTVAKSLHAVICKRTRKPSIQYPRLNEYVKKECGGSITVFARRMEVSPYHLRQVLVHGTPAGKKLCKKIEKETNMTAGEAFMKNVQEEICGA